MRHAAVNPALSTAHSPPTLAVQADVHDAVLDLHVPAQVSLEVELAGAVWALEWLAACVQVHMTQQVVHAVEGLPAHLEQGGYQRAVGSLLPRPVCPHCTRHTVPSSGTTERGNGICSLGACGGTCSSHPIDQAPTVAAPQPLPLSIPQKYRFSSFKAPPPTGPPPRPLCGQASTGQAGCGNVPYLALERLHRRVHNHVGLEGLLLHEGLEADVALVWPDAGVDQHVALHVGLQRELPAADLTLELLHTLWGQRDHSGLGR